MSILESLNKQISISEAAAPKIPAPPEDKDGFYTEEADIKRYLGGNFELPGSSITIVGNTVNVDGDCRLSYKNSKKVLKIKFGKINGEFATDIGALESLKGFPEEVMNMCWINRLPNLKSMEGCPKKVGSLWVNNCNNLTSLKGMPTKIRSIWLSSCKKLTSLKGCSKEVMNIKLTGVPIKDFQGGPTKVTGNYESYGPAPTIVSLKGMPKEVGGLLKISNLRNLKSLEFSPRVIGGDFNVAMLRLVTSVEGGPELVGGDYIIWNTAKSPNLDKYAINKHIRKHTKVKGAIVKTVKS